MPINKETQNKPALRASDIPERYQPQYRKAMAGKSLRAAVNAFCLECVTWDHREVGLCTSSQCPLYPYRPYKQKKKNIVIQDSVGGDGNDN